MKDIKQTYLLEELTIKYLQNGEARVVVLQTDCKKNSKPKTDVLEDDIINPRYDYVKGWWFGIRDRFMENSSSYLFDTSETVLSEKESRKLTHIIDVEEYKFWKGKVNVQLIKDLYNKASNNFYYGKTFISISRKTLFLPKIVSFVIHDFKGVKCDYRWEKIG